MAAKRGGKGNQSIKPNDTPTPRGSELTKTQVVSPLLMVLVGIVKVDMVVYNIKCRSKRRERR